MQADSTSRPNSYAPMLWAALSFAAGIVMGRACWRPPLWWAIAVVAAVTGAAVLARRSRKLAIAAALLGFVAAGALCWAGRAEVDRWPALQRYEAQPVLIAAHLTSDPPPDLEGVHQRRDTFDIETESIQLVDRDGVAMAPAEPLRTGMRVSVYSGSMWDDGSDEADAADTTLHYGQRIRVRGKLRVPRNFGNPGAFDYRQYLLDRGIVALISTRADRIETLPGSGGTWLGTRRSVIRESILRHIAATWPAADAAMLDAMLVSERSLLDHETRVLYQRSGIYHLVVVSGLNLAIIVGFVYWLARLAGLANWAATLVMFGSAVSFAWIADDGAPVWRATLMVGVYMITRLLYRDRSPLNAIGTAALILLFLDPRALFGASFQLSFLAVLVIAALAVPLLERTCAPYHRGLRDWNAVERDAALAPRVAQFRIDLRMIAGAVGPLVPRWMARLVRRPPAILAGTVLAAAARGCFAALELVVVSAAMQVCLALPMAWYFHRAITIGVPANIIAVPLAGILLPASVVAVAASYASAALAHPAAWVTSAALHAIHGSMGALWSLHVSDVRVPMPSLLMTAAAAASFCLAALAMRMRRSLAILGCAAVIATAAWIGFARQNPRNTGGALEITAIDVGQGDALLVVTPDGRTLLIDGGGQLGTVHSDFDFGEDVVAPYLWQRGIARLDAVALTHAHQDHIGGLASLLEIFRPAELWLGSNPDTAQVRRLLETAERMHVRLARHVTGDAFRFGEIDVRVLAPPPDWRVRATAQNNDSLALLIAYRRTSALLPGDTEKKMERLLATQEVRADVLKVAHHGSATSTTGELLEAAQPRFAVISDGLRNSFGHPRPDVLARLAAARVATYRTDIHGAVSFFLDGERVWVSVPALPPDRRR